MDFKETDKLEPVEIHSIATYKSVTWPDLLNRCIKIAACCFPQLGRIYRVHNKTHSSNIQAAECKQELQVIKIYISFLLPVKCGDILKALSQRCYITRLHR